MYTLHTLFCRHTQWQCHLSIFSASIHRIHPPSLPILPPSLPLFHFPNPNCSVGSSSFTVIAFHLFHLLSERLDIYLRTLPAPITWSSPPVASCVLRRGKPPPTAEIQPPDLSGNQSPAGRLTFSPRFLLNLFCAPSGLNGCAGGAVRARRHGDLTIIRWASMRPFRFSDI